MAIRVVETGDDLVFGLALDEVGRDVLEDGQYIELAARFAAGLEGHPDVRFVVQTAVSPDSAAAQRGRIVVHVFGLSATKSRREMQDLGEDLHDLLSVPPEPWTFRPVTSQAELEAAINPIDPKRLAEITRREAACPPPGGLHTMGYHQEPGKPEREPFIWSTWRFRPTARRSADLVMLGQDEPIVMRTIVQPTDLKVDERDALEQLIADVGP